MKMCIFYLKQFIKCIIYKTYVLNDIQDGCKADKGIKYEILTIVHFGSDLWFDIHYGM